MNEFGKILGYIIPGSIGEVGYQNKDIPTRVIRNKAQKIETIRLFNRSLYWKNLTNG